MILLQYARTANWYQFCEWTNFCFLTWTKRAWESIKVCTSVSLSRMHLLNRLSMFLQKYKKKTSTWFLTRIKISFSSKVMIDHKNTWEIQTRIGIHFITSTVYSLWTVTIGRGGTGRCAFWKPSCMFTENFHTHRYKTSWLHHQHCPHNEYFIAPY